MPRSRGSSSSDVVQQQRHSTSSTSTTPRPPLHLRTTACSEANSAVHRPVDRSPRVSPRGPPAALQERKKGGGRATELETKLTKAQEELRKLRHQLAAVEAAKLEAQQALAKAESRIPPASPTPKEEGNGDAADGEEGEKPPLQQEESVSSPATTDVFEVEAPIENEADSNREKEATPAAEKTAQGDEQQRDAAGGAAPEKEGETNMPAVDDLKAELLEKEKEVEILLEWNSIFKAKAAEEAKKAAGAARAREAELAAKLTTAEDELKQSRARADRLEEQLESVEAAKAALETEVRRLRVQTEQWRKAAEAAAAVLDAEERRVAERCGSMEKHVGVGWGSPTTAGRDRDDDGSGGRRKAAGGIRVLGDLWRKKTHHK